MFSKPPRVVVVGGGFGGIYAASYLAKSDLATDPGVEITLVDSKNYFTFTPLIAEVAAGTLGREHVTYPHRTLAAERGFQFLHACVTGVDHARKVVSTDAGDVPYDYLVIASGAEPQYFGNAEIAARSMAFATVEHALQVRSRVIDALEHAQKIDDETERRRMLTFVIAGGGPAGIEIASEIHGLVHQVLSDFYSCADEARVIVAVASDRILIGFDEALAAMGLEELRRRGIEVLLDTLVTGIGDGSVLVKGAGGACEIESHTLIWTAGTTPGSWLQEIGFPTERGALVVDRYLRVSGRECEFAVGDVAYLVDERLGKPYPRVAPIAISQGIRAAANIENAVLQRAQEPYHAFHAGKIVSLGSGVALAEVLGIRLTGRLAWMIYRGAYLLKLVGMRNKVKVAITLMLNRIFGPDIAYEEGRSGL
ncbi:MAG: NAD(P)/FAD-dependent oxidoreductase [Gemmatimonadales bacterium]